MTPTPLPSHLDQRRVAAEVAALGLPLADWHAGRDRATPHARSIRYLRAAGWPVDTAVIDLPQREHSGLRAGQRTGDAPQAVTVVPASWLMEFARRLGWPWPQACRWTVEG